MSKGIAVVSGSSDLKHKLMDNGVAELGVTSAVSTLSGTIVLLDETSNNLATRINDTKSDVNSRIATATGEYNDQDAEVNTTSTELVADTTRLHGAATGVYTNGALSLHAADAALDNQLSASRDDITQVNADKTTPGSLARAIDQHLKGSGLTGTLLTVEALSSSIASTDLVGDVATAIQTMKDDVYGAGAGVTTDDLAITRTAISIQEAAALLEEQDQDTMINNSSTAIGLNANRSLSYSAQEDYISAATTINAAQGILEAQQNGTNVTRLADMTGSLLTTAQMTVASGENATFTGDVAVGSTFTVPTVTAVVGSKLQSPASPETGEIMYVQVGSSEWSYGLEFKDSTETVAENNKFYFYENGHWFASPFHSE